MTKKKVIGLALAVLMAVALFAGCSGGTGGAESSDSAAPADSASAESSQSAEGESSAPAETGDAATPSDSGEQASDGGEQAAGGSGAAFDDYPRPKTKSDEEFTVAYIHTRSETETSQRFMHQVDQEVAHRGWTYVDGYYEDDQQFRQVFMNLINQDVDAIILEPVESMSSKEDLVQMARDAEIGVYNVDNQLVEGIISNCTTTNGVAGVDLLYKIGEENYWTGNVSMFVTMSMQALRERIDPVASIIDLYEGMSVLTTEDISPTGDPATTTYDAMQALMERYGEDIDGVFCANDFIAEVAAEAITQAGRDDIWTAGIGGGSQAWSYIRNETPYQYNYAMPTELCMHNTFEIISQLQVLGLNPGEAGTLLDHSGGTVFASGHVVTRANVPAIGESIHAAFNYYGGDPTDENAWYNWTDAGGPMIITDGSEE